MVTKTKNVYQLRKKQNLCIKCIIISDITTINYLCQIYRKTNTQYKYIQHTPTVLILVHISHIT